MSLMIVRFASSACGAMGRTPAVSVQRRVPFLTCGFSSIHDKISSFGTVAQPSSPASLPHLPVPPLSVTLQKYLRTVKPLVTDAEYAHTEEVVKEFGSRGKIGEKLQVLLVEKGRTSENWLAEWWLNSAYMDYRSPVVVFSSPGLVFPLEKINSKSEQIRHTAKLIAGALDYKRKIDENLIPLEKMGTKPLDMSQYTKVMSTCRIPGVTRDSVAHYGLQPNPPTHIIVAHNNHFFKMTVYGENGVPLSEDQLLQQLDEVVSQSATATKPVGILTTENRNIWGKVYKKLTKDAQNTKSLEEIQRGIFLVCIDGPNPETGAPNKQTVAALQMVHGMGSRGNGGNRWYDKTIQFVIGTQGEVGLTYEHSPAEGPPIANLMDHIVEHTRKGATLGKSSSRVMSPERLQFNIGSDIEEDIRIAQRHLDTLVADLDMSCCTTKVFGKNFIKSQKMSPDSFFQMGIQLAFYRIHGKPGACYESASTRQYIHGRTETIRSTSVEAAEFCKTMLSSNSDADKVQALKKAIDGHKKYALEAVSGFGVDRHLLGLKLIAIEKGIDVPQFYLDPGYLRSSCYRISTSQVASKNDSFMCYGPLVPDGYSCCYNPRANEMSFGIGAHNSCKETNAQKFREALEQSLVDMHDVLIRSQGSKL